MLSAWRGNVFELVERGLFLDAKLVLRKQTMLTPADPDPWRALMEVAAAEDDYTTCRIALANCLSGLQSATNTPRESLEPIWVARDDVRLKLAQVWVSHDPRNAHARAFLYHALERFPWFVPPPAETETADEVYLRYGEALAALETEFSAMQGELTLWRDWVQRTDVIGFRGEFCTSQAGSHDPSNFGPSRLLQAYTVAYEYAASHDRLGALAKFSDDGAFGGLRFRVGGRVVSSDMIDSSLQLNFIARHCGFHLSDQLTLLDIGAGWGRLACRFLELFPRGFAFALDAVPFPSFLAQRYLEYRGVFDRAVTGSRTKLDTARPGAFQIAANVHSWSEAPLASIDLWLSKLDALQVPFLFFVPHGLPAVSLEKDGPGQLIVPAILAHGWRVLVDEPKYGSSLQRQRAGLYPTAHYYLFGKEV